jgi:hypothetical protein
MERPVAQSGLNRPSLASGDLVFSVAGREDDADIRRLLHENELGGWVRLSLARSPDAFAADFGLSRSHAFIIARNRATGETVGICERTVRDAYVDGDVRRLPYLGSLRVAPAYRHRIRALKGGFDAIRRLLDQPADLPYALTSITADNHVAQRVLCAGLPGMPIYRRCGVLSTFALRTTIRAAPSGIETATAADIPAIAVLLQRAYRDFQFAPVWRTADLERLFAAGGLRVEDFLIARRGPGVRACLAVWDQSGIKQTMVRGYASWLDRIRPLANLASPLTGMPRLPRPGSALRQVYLSHLAVEGDDTQTFNALLTAGLTRARRRGFDVALLGLPTAHPFCAAAKRRRAIRYRSLLHLVHWPEAASSVDEVTRRIAYPEIALM